jgi:glycosyltransferase involved in cell wall biosynthesis
MEPLVTIIMALYQPNVIWLKELLQSLNNQDYPNLNLLVWNDCPNEENHEEIFKECITKFSYQIIKGKNNVGSNKAFEKLTELANGDYLAYCDQDDIWHSNKISILIAQMEKSHATLGCSDMCIIDGEGNHIADKIKEVRPRHVFIEGEKQIKSLLIRNFVTGCTMIIQADVAKSALPFPEYQLIVHDHWLALWNAVYGKIFICPLSLIDYRIHGDNQTTVLSGVFTKEDYFEKRCLLYYKRLIFLRKRGFPHFVQNLIKEKLEWIKRRIEYFQHPNLVGACKLLIKLRANVLITGFEILIPIVSDKQFEIIIKKIKS